MERSSPSHGGHRASGAEAADGPLTGSLVQALLAFVVFSLSGSVAAVLIGVPPPGPEGWLAPRVEALFASSLIGGLATLAFFLAWPPGVAWKVRGSIGAPARAYLVFLIGWVPVALLLYPWVLRELGQPLPPQPLLRYFTQEPASWYGPVLALGGACLVGPLAEEIVFRGYIQGAFARIVRPALAVVVSAALFGLLHGPAYALPVGLLGLFFGYLRERHGGLAAPAFAHVLHNTATVGATVLFPEFFDWMYPR